jgi:hypothetical protein
MQVGSVQSGSGSLVIQAAKTTFAYYDPADTNQDGVVSGAEALAYFRSHPQRSSLNPPSAGAASKAPSGLASRASQTSAVTYHDPADTNQDGLVSGLEALTYSRLHPSLGSLVAASSGASANSRSRGPGLASPYSSSGNVNPAHQGTNGLLDLKA